MLSQSNKAGPNTTCGTWISTDIARYGAVVASQSLCYQLHLPSM